MPGFEVVVLTVFLFYGAPGCFKVICLAEVVNEKLFSAMTEVWVDACLGIAEANTRIKILKHRLFLLHNIPLRKKPVRRIPKEP